SSWGRCAGRCRSSSSGASEVSCAGRIISGDAAQATRTFAHFARSLSVIPAHAGIQAFARMTGSLKGRSMAQTKLDALYAEIRACTVCAAELPLGPRPVLHGKRSARLMIISQAPGTKVHETGLSFNDRSGDRLRDWLGTDRETFYDERRIAILPMGLCYPGR